MTTWIMKSETDDPDRALANVEDQRSKGYTAWIEDEHGKAVDEELLRTNKAVPTKPSVRGSRRRLSLGHLLLPVSLFFTWLVYGLTSNFKSFVATPAAWRCSPRSAARRGAPRLVTLFQPSIDHRASFS